MKAKLIGLRLPLLMIIVLVAGWSAPTALADTVACGQVGGPTVVAPVAGITVFPAIPCAGGVTVAAGATATYVNTAARADYIIQAVFTKSMAGPQTSTIVFTSAADFGNLLGPNVMAWQELHGMMALLGGQASITVTAATLTPGGNSCVLKKGGCPTSGLRGNGPFNRMSKMVPLAGAPPWTRSVTYVVTFTQFAKVGSQVILGQGAGNNPWTPTTPIPEPATLILLASGITAVLARVRQQRR